MSTLAETSTGDLDISTGNFAVVTDVAQCTAWKLTGLFSIFKGEWFRDSRSGLPAIQYVFVKNPNLNLISQLFARVLAFPPAVVQVLSLSLDYQPRSRTLDTTFQVKVNSGATITGGLGAAFIVDQQTGSGT